MAYRNYATANSRIVDPSGNGDFKTIAAALTASVSGQTIFIRPGTYTENPALVAGVNLCSFDCDALTPNVIILGKCTFTGAGTVIISGIKLETNSDFCLAVTGSSGSTCKLINCFINANNNTTISLTGTATLNCYNCQGDTGTTGISYLSMSSTGSCLFAYCNFENTGATVTATTSSAGTLAFRYSRIVAPVSSTSTCVLQIESSSIFTANQNTLAVTVNGTSGANPTINNSLISSGTASAISVGTGVTLNVGCIVVNSTNTNAVTGVGTLVNGGISFTNTSYLINTTTQSQGYFDVGGISFDGGANLLSAYSTGTFTPTMIGQSTAGTTTYSAQNGYYTRIGNLVTIIATVVGSAATGTGFAELAGFPFTIKNQTNGRPDGSMNVNNSSTWTWPASATSIALEGQINTTNAIPWVSGPGAVGNYLTIRNAAFQFEYTLPYQI